MNIVALGSSFAAGPDIEPVLDSRAKRSGRNYAHFLAADLGANLTDVTVSGATTPTILTTPQRVLGRRFPPQIESVDSATDLVTVTVGGNDLGYLGGLIFASAANLVGRHWYGKPAATVLRAAAGPKPVTEDMVIGTTQSMVRIVGEVTRRAPTARVVLVDYLPILDENTTAGGNVPLSSEEIAQARAVAARLSAIFVDAGQQSSASVVPATDYPLGHGVTSAEPWVNGFSARALASSFHPNAAGMRAVADAILARLSDERSQS